MSQFQRVYFDVFLLKGVSRANPRFSYLLKEAKSLEDFPWASGILASKDLVLLGAED